MVNLYVYLIKGGMMRKPFVFFMIVFIGFALFTQVSNTDKPLRGKWDLKMKKIWEVDEAGEDVFAEISDMVISEDNYLFVQDRKNFKVYIFDQNGKFISSFGKRGEGPGEIKRMMRMFFVKNTIVLPEEGRLHFFDKKGKYIKTEIFPLKLRPRIFISKDIFISAPMAPREAVKEPVEIAIYNINSKEKTTITTYNPFEKATTAKKSKGEEMVIAVVIGGLTPMMMVHHHEGKIYYGMSDSYNIYIVDMRGKAVGGFSVMGRKQKPVSMDFKKGLFKGMGDIPQDMLKNIINGLPGKASFFQEIIVDKRGLIYVFIADPENRSTQGIDIFSLRGKYLYSSEIKVKAGDSIRRYHLDDDILILALESEEGDITIGKYAVSLPQ